MELDKRIKEGKKPLTCFDVEEAKEFIGKEGYFCRNEHLFSDAKKIGSTSVLVQIKPNEPAPFVPQIAIDLDQPYGYEYFLPAEWLNPEEHEKKYRPFSLEEFLKIFDIGDQIGFRSKDNGEVKYAMFVGYIDDFLADNTDRSDGENDVMIGIYRFSLSCLFENYDLYFEDEWQPFGVIDEQE